MSRSTVAKSRADKPGKTTNAPTPAVAHEIVSGKYNDQDWNVMTDHDDGDDLVQDIVEELCNSTLDIIYQNYLQRQLIPYTVLQAKEALVQIIEWQFLARDEGEQNIESNLTWTEDEEPPAAVTDCWAQGSVPKNLILNTPRSVLEETIEEEPISQVMENVEIKESVGEQEEIVTAVSTDKQEQEEETSIIIEESVEEPTVETKEIMGNTKEQEMQNKKFKPHYGRLNSPKTKELTQSLEEREMKMFYDSLPTPPPPKTPETVVYHMPNSCHSIVKLQAGRPPGNRDILYDDAGNVISMAKISPDKLPNHRVKTRFKVIDPQVEAAQVQLEAMRTGRYLKLKQPVPPHRTETKKDKLRDENQIPTGKQSHSYQNTALNTNDGITPLPPPLIDSMEVSPGVVVKERDRIKRGPKQQPQKTELTFRAGRNLRPIAVRTISNTFSVQELLDNQQPIIHKLAGSPPIPPIVPHPPAQKAL